MTCTASEWLRQDSQLHRLDPEAVRSPSAPALLARSGAGSRLRVQAGVLPETRWPLVDGLLQEEDLEERMVHLEVEGAFQAE